MLAIRNDQHRISTREPINCINSTLNLKFTINIITVEENGKFEEFSAQQKVKRLEKEPERSSFDEKTG